MANLFSSSRKKTATKKSTAKKKTTKEVKDIRTRKTGGVQYAYLLDCIKVEGIKRATDKRKIEYFFDCFNREYNYAQNKRMYPNLQARVAEYLQGLPTCCTLDYSYYDIIQLGKKWGYCGTPRKENQFCDNWWSVMAGKLIQIYDYYCKPKTAYSQYR